jgi:hypothetical protein
MDILYLASLAPSGHNTQPWTVRIVGPQHWIIGSDRERWLPAVDPHNREMLLSLGAFLENLIIAAKAHGYAVDLNVIAKSSSQKIRGQVLKYHFLKNGMADERLVYLRTFNTATNLRLLHTIYQVLKYCFCIQEQSTN